MKPIVLILFWLYPAFARTQEKDSMPVFPSFTQLTSENQNFPQKDQNPDLKKTKPEVFTSGFIDILNSGQVNASARFIRLFIGEPGKFFIPLSLYSGVSSNYFQNTQSFSQRSNDVLVTNFINPLSGLANISIDGIKFFEKESPGLTQTGLLYHMGLRILTGIRTGSVNDPLTGTPINFLNSFGSLGFYFQTGAWERNNAKNIGLFWFAPRLIGCYSSPARLAEILPDSGTNGLYYGFSLAWGVEIDKLVNIKVVYYKYFKKPEIDYYLPIYQFSFNYALKK